MTNIPTIQFEAQLWRATHSVSSKEEKTVVVLHVHPTEAEALMDMSKLGKRFMVVMAELDEQDQPVKQKQPMKRSQRAYQLCKGQRFQAFVQNKLGGGRDEPTATAGLKMYCGIVSRSELDTNAEAAEKFDKLVAEFERTV